MIPCHAQVQVCVLISMLSLLFAIHRGWRGSRKAAEKKKHFHIQAHLLLLMLSIRGNVMNKIKKIKKENARGDEKESLREI